MLNLHLCKFKINNTGTCEQSKKNSVVSDVHEMFITQIKHLTVEDISPRHTAIESSDTSHLHGGLEKPKTVGYTVYKSSQNLNG